MVYAQFSRKGRFDHLLPVLLTKCLTYKISLVSTKQSGASTATQAPANIAQKLINHFCGSVEAISNQTVVPYCGSVLTVFAFALARG